MKQKSVFILLASLMSGQSLADVAGASNELSLDAGSFDEQIVVATAPDASAASESDNAETLKLKLKLMEMQLEMERLKSGQSNSASADQSISTTTEASAAVVTGGYSDPNYWPVQAEYKSEPLALQKKPLGRLLDSDGVKGAFLVTYEDYFKMDALLRARLGDNLGVVLKDGDVKYPGDTGLSDYRKPINYTQTLSLLKEAVHKDDQLAVNFIIKNYTISPVVSLDEIWGGQYIRKDIYGCFTGGDDVVKREVESDGNATGSNNDFFNDAGASNASDTKVSSREEIKATPIYYEGAKTCASMDDEVYSRFKNSTYSAENAKFAVALFNAGTPTSSCEARGGNINGYVVTANGLLLAMNKESIKPAPEGSFTIQTSTIDAYKAPVLNCGY